MDPLCKDLVMIVMQFLREEHYTEAVHSLEKESGFFFNLSYFEEKVLAGDWDEVEKYLSGFTKVEDNSYSMKIYYDLRKQKYLEALDRNAKPEALEILLKDLKVFSAYNSDAYSEITKLLTLDNFRMSQKLSNHGDTKEARSTMMGELKKLIKANPLLNDKLEFPSLRSSRLRTLINQSLNWQHQLCTNRRPIPDIKTLFTDHSCRSVIGAFVNSPVNIPAMGGAMPSAYTPTGFQVPFPSVASAANFNGLAGWMSNASTTSSVLPAVIPSQVSGTKRPFTPPVTPGMLEFQSADHQQLLKRVRTAEPIEEIIHFNSSMLLMHGELLFQATNSAVGERSSQSLDESLTRGATLNGLKAVSENQEISDHVKATGSNPIQWRLLTLDALDTGNKVSRITYTNSGNGLLVLGSGGIQKLWVWDSDVQNPSGKATANVLPHLLKSSSGLLMANDIAGVELKEASPCLEISKNDLYAVSACGGKLSLFNLKTYRILTTFMPPQPVSTSVTFHPLDNNIVVVGMDDSAIYMYNVKKDKLKSVLKGHQKRVTGLAFSTKLNILISSGADAHICIWSIDTWEKRNSFPLQLPTGHWPIGDTRVQFDSNQVRFLVSHETQLALYDATNVDRIQQWIPQDVLSAPISYAAFSCNSELIYASFIDGNVGIFEADSLSLRSCVSPSTYLAQPIQGGEVVYPLVVATHPQDPHQFALGLTDGSVIVLEQVEPDGECGASQPADKVFANDIGSSRSTNNHAPEQVQR
ncbi:topless-related protein 3-like [Apium graveolens]|uniref:topless-related protein 3-like n=1 Tax=Apium graveolens TaxID=4045 RepID=UPI003D7BCACB